MTLYHYEDKIENKHVIRDVETAFEGIELVADEDTKKIIKNIDKAKFNGGNRFIDRFGAYVYISELSTGCKAALCVKYITNSVIDTVECGYNARDVIIKNCKEGNAIIYDDGITVAFDDTDRAVDVYIHGRNIKDVQELNEFIDSYEFWQGV